MTTTNNLYVSLSDVLKLLNEFPSSNTNKIINSLPEPINPLDTTIAEIDKMIEDYRYDEMTTAELFEIFKTRLLSPKL